jgi:hypothetical protein
MNRYLALATLAGLLGGVVPAHAVDLKMIERRIAREPAYQSGAPRYCLVVFGPQAKTRVWLVRDGDILYADLNANGDLTEGGKCLAVRRHAEGFGVVLTPPLAPNDGVPANTRLKLKFFDDQVELYLLNDQLQVVSSDANGPVQFSAEPASASILHVGGPLTLTLDGMCTLRRGPDGTRLSVKVGTQGLGQGAFVARFHAEVYSKVSRELVPVADLTFPAKARGAEPRRTRVVLDDRC